MNALGLSINIPNDLRARSKVIVAFLGHRDLRSHPVITFAPHLDSKSWWPSMNRFKLVGRGPS
jgi:hypothetical protein